MEKSTLPAIISIIFILLAFKKIGLLAAVILGTIIYLGVHL
ncbi:hypothetical protein IMCC1989_671 [gamma proteobacterium IMCC1989]|nr:hypothetical protein IMCC1989_671 [gamma proteobacterium IMCC1989]